MGLEIKIVKRLTPFSHRLGVAVPLPGTPWILSPFPEKIIWQNLESGKTKEEALNWKGPLKNFTTILDLEKGVVVLQGEGHKRVIQGGRSQKPSERLSLGSHKKLCWDNLDLGADLETILPLFFYLSEQMPSGSGDGGALQFLEKWEERSPHEIPNLLERFFKTAFYGMFAPRRFDFEWQGILPQECHLKGSLFSFFSQGRVALRSLFFQEKGQDFYILPKLPSQFHAGRFIHLQTQIGAVIGIEWAKKKIQRVVVETEQLKEEQEIRLKLPAEISSFRVRKNLKERGLCVSKKESILIRSKETLFLDQFS